MRLVLAIVLLAACSAKHNSPASDVAGVAPQPAHADFKVQPGANRAAEDAEHEAAAAKQALEAAMHNETEAKNAVDTTQKQLDELDAQIKAAQAEVVSAQSEVDHSAKAKLDQLRKERDESKTRAAAARGEAERMQRLNHAQLPPGCFDNPTAKECQ